MTDLPEGERTRLQRAFWVGFLGTLLACAVVVRLVIGVRRRLREQRNVIDVDPGQTDA